jgi:putative transposase
MMNAPSGQEHVVRKCTFTEEPIAFALKQAELGTRVEEVCRQMGISEATFYL